MRLRRAITADGSRPHVAVTLRGGNRSRREGSTAAGHRNECCSASGKLGHCATGDHFIPSPHLDRTAKAANLSGSRR
jgi:hypothetical protein